SRHRRSYSTLPRRLILRSGFRPSIVPSTCCSTRAITARPRPRRCAPGSAMRRCAFRRYCLHTPSPRWPAPTPHPPLMCFNAARLPARVDAMGNLISLFDQDRSLWDKTLVIEGLKLLELSAAGPDLSGYHLEAAIASIHATASRVGDTDWGTIISLYDKLMGMDPSPIVALNRAIAIAQREGPERGLAE